MNTDAGDFTETVLCAARTRELSIYFHNKGFCIFCKLFFVKESVFGKKNVERFAALLSQLLLRSVLSVKGGRIRKYQSVAAHGNIGLVNFYLQQFLSKSGLYA